MIGYDALVDDVALVPRAAVGLVAVTGPDAHGFLQSLASQDLAGIAPGETRHSLLLEPQGKLVAEFHVLAVGDEELWLRCEPAVAPVLAAGLARFKIRVKVEIDDRSAASSALMLRGPHAAAVAFDAPPSCQVLRIDWPASVGRELVGPHAAIDRAVRPAVTAADEAALDVVRIEARVPRQPDDIDARTIAQEALLEQTAVSFTKGCFVGQELVCRIDTRGHVNRTLRRVRAESPMTVGAEVRTREGRAAGTITSAAVSPRQGPIALATLRREVVAGDALEIEGVPAWSVD
jgi:folate-binding protein YgfZ